MPTDDFDAFYDERYELLSNARRRYVLYYLYRQRRHVPVSELARAVATAENQGVASAQTVRRTRQSLTATHLPRLARGGLVTIDGGGTSLTREALRRGVLGTPFRRRRWRQLPAVLGVLVWSFLVAAAGGFEPLASLSWPSAILSVAGLAVGIACLDFATERLAHAPAPSFELLVE
jgi:hypothetical protein